MGGRRLIMFDKYNNETKLYLNREMKLVSLMGKYGFKFVSIIDNGAHDELRFESYRKTNPIKIMFTVTIDAIHLKWVNLRIVPDVTNVSLKILDNPNLDKELSKLIKEEIL